jgi:3-keto-5-aminohexanoate cleavage enzyme
MEKLIITIAPTGNVPTRELTPHAVLTNDEIVADLVKCQELGASVAHVHVRDENLMPTSERARYEDLLNKMDAAGLDLVRQVSTGARGGENTVEWRGQMLDLPQAEMASLSTGSSNFPTSTNSNAPGLIKDLAKKMKDNNLKPEIEIFDVSMIHQAVFLQKKSLIKEGPIQFNFVLNVPGSLPATPKNLMFLVDNLPEGATWTVSGIGKSQVQMITMAIAMGGHVRTGLEDVLIYDYETGEMATNAQLIERVVKIAKAVGREIATPEEARQMLGLASK